MTDGAGEVRGYNQDRKERQAFEFKDEYESMAAGPAWKNAHKAADLLGAKSLQVGDFRDSFFDVIPILDLVHFVEQAVDRVRPDTIYTHYPGDLSVDHSRTAEAVITACRPKPGHPVKGLYFFEVASNTEWALPLTFQPQLFVEIDVAEKWIVLKEAYGSETRDMPHPRSEGVTVAMAHTRGSQAGLTSAEAFMIGRVVR